MANHFKCIDIVIESVRKTISEKFIKDLHKILKSGTSSDGLDWFKVGDYKKNSERSCEEIKPQNLKL